MDRFKDQYSNPNNRLWAGGRRKVFLASAAALFIIIASVAIFSHSKTIDTVIDTTKIAQQVKPDGEPVKMALDANNLLMTDAQCVEAFPNLFDEIDKAVARRNGKKISPVELSKGQVLGFVYNQQLYIYDHEPRLYLPEEKNHFYSRSMAQLHNLHRAILTSPEPIPNFHFAFNTEDKVAQDMVSWSLAYNLNDKETKLWPMPDFGFWSWPETHVNSYATVRLRADAVDKKYGMKVAGKKPKAIWRGNVMGLQVRKDLLKYAEGKPWSDIKVLDWRNKKTIKTELLSMSDHCKYQYLIHTEGHTYSGRLKYLLQCNSVTIIHKMEWQQHFHNLLKHEGPDQNYVQVERDWSDLDEKIKMLEANPELKEKIAKNAKKFAGWYLSPAATNCYWRRFMRTWAATLEETKGWKFLNKDGTPAGTDIESFVLMQKVDWDPY
ncbi:hypothetical protein BJ508DRAFT_414288 [Ascobolus immersus RN42]|uniref:Glycosyl transferase CAP10 domain-containing protein n=1 Tax=Ascobolus immersus RN42 TaxID=1160509 RepID=A0A3N4I9W1_ASCIM|nr:hypothetical protein BJ508DRAFT_414288 [Ascobolus immersus RN42]